MSILTLFMLMFGDLIDIRMVCESPDGIHAFETRDNSSCVQMPATSDSVIRTPDNRRYIVCLTLWYTLCSRSCKRFRNTIVNERSVETDFPDANTPLRAKKGQESTVRMSHPVNFTNALKGQDIDLIFRGSVILDLVLLRTK